MGRDATLLDRRGATLTAVKSPVAVYRALVLVDTLLAIVSYRADEHVSPLLKRNGTGMGHATTGSPLSPNKVRRRHGTRCGLDGAPRVRVLR